MGVVSDELLLHTSAILAMRPVRHSYTSGQPSNPRRHPTCSASSQWSHTVSSTPCHGAWTFAPLSAHPVHRVQMHGASNRDTHLYPPHNISSVHLTTTTYVRRSGRITSGTWSGQTTQQGSAFSSPTPAPSWYGPPKKSLGPAQPPPHR